MKVNLSKTKENVDCHIGDIVLHDGKSCMVIDTMVRGEQRFGLLIVDGVHAGDVVNTVASLQAMDKIVSEVLIKCADVVITKGEA